MHQNTVVFVIINVRMFTATRPHKSSLLAEYNVQELQNKISMLTDRCQSAERERKEARRERDETVKQLQEVLSGTLFSCSH